MKKTVYHSKSIRNRILIFTLSAILGMCLLISLFSYYIFRHYLQNTLIQSTETSLRLLSESMDNSMDEVYRLVRYCQTDSNIANYIEHNPNPGSVLSVSTYDSFYEECSRNSSYNYMPRIAIVSQEHYLQVVTATYSSTADLATLIPELPYYEELLTADDYDFSPGIVSDPFHRAGRKVLPVIRPITYQYNNRQAGYLFIEISADLFTIPLKDYSCPSDSFLYLSIAGHTYIYENGGLQEFTPEYSILDDLSTYSLTGTTQISKIHSATMGEQILVTTPLNMPDCYLSQSISHAERTNQAVLFMGILACILIGILSIGVVLMLLMNRMITVPVSRLQTRMVRIAGGDFSRDPSVEWDHELGDIGRGINDLSENVSELMEKRLEDEKQKQDLEYKMLQSQINPHFLYNTLNSIKWMATIQGATGISEMVATIPGLGGSTHVLYSLLVLTVSVFCLTSLDTATRLARYMFQEFWLEPGQTYKEATGYKAVLTNPVVSTVITVVLGIGLGLTGYSKIWPLFGASNQLLAAIGLLAVATWLGKVGKNNKMFLFPMVFMLIVTITSLVQTLIANFKGLGAGVGIGWCVARIVLAGLLVILALILAFDGFKTLANQKKAK